MPEKKNLTVAHYEPMSDFDFESLQNIYINSFSLAFGISKRHLISKLNHLEINMKDWVFGDHGECPECKKNERKNIFLGFLEDLEDKGYHQDIIDRCRIALLSERGMMIFTGLPQKFDYEYLVQALLKVYSEITDQ